MSEKYLKEIEEILKEAEAAPPPEKDQVPPPRSSGRYVLRPPRLVESRYLSAGKLGMAAMAILLLALVVGGVFGLKALFAGFVVGLLVVAYLMFFCAAQRAPRCRRGGEDGWWRTSRRTRGGGSVAGRSVNLQHQSVRALLDGVVDESFGTAHSGDGMHLLAEEAP